MRTEEEIRERLNAIKDMNHNANLLSAGYAHVKNLAKEGEASAMAKDLFRQEKILLWVLGEEDDWP